MFFQKDEVAGPRSVTSYIYFIKDFTKLNGLLYLLGVFCPKVLMIAIRHKRAQYKASLAVFLVPAEPKDYKVYHEEGSAM